MAREEAERLAEKLDKLTLESSASAEKHHQANVTIESLKEKLADESSLREQSEARGRQLNSMTGQMAQLQTANEQQVELSELRIGDLSAQLELLEKDKHSLGEDLLQAQSDAAKASAALADRDQLIRSQNEDWAVQKSRLQQQLDSQSQLLVQLDATASMHKETQSEIVQLKAELNQQSVRFKSELNDLNASHDRKLQDQARTSATDLHSARIELKHYQSQVVEFTLQLSQSKEQQLESEQQRAVAETRFTEAQAKNDRIAERHNEQLVSLEQGAQQERQLLTQQVSNLQGQLEANKEAHAIALEKLDAALVSERAKKVVPASRPSKPKRKNPSGSREKPNNVSDDLTKISGIGPVAAKKLRKLGVKSFEQIAKWTTKDVHEFSKALSVGSRIKSEKWVRQAKKLAR